MEAGRQEEESADEKVVEGEDFCHHRPLPTEPGHSEQSSSQDRTGSRTCQPNNEKGPLINFLDMHMRVSWLIFDLGFCKALSNFRQNCD